MLTVDHSHVYVRRALIQLVTLTALSVLFDPRMLLAQQSDSSRWRHGIWADGGFGVATDELGAGFAVRYWNEPSVIVLRTAASFELFSNTYWDGALLYGRTMAIGPFDASASLGVGVLLGDTGGSLFRRGSPLTPAVGLALDASLLWRPARFLGLGIIAYGNLNEAHSFGGVIAALQLGWRW